MQQTLTIVQIFQLMLFFCQLNRLIPMQDNTHVNPHETHLYVFTNKATAWRYGWCVRTVEVSMHPEGPATGQLHPRSTFHCMLLVQPTWFQFQNFSPNAALPTLSKFQHTAVKTRYSAQMFQLISCIPPTVHSLRTPQHYHLPTLPPTHL